MKPHRPGCLGTIFTQGFQARRSGMPRAANPHKMDEIAADAWFTGWDEAAEPGWVAARAEPERSIEE
jgi:ribosome modulation factor